MQEVLREQEVALSQFQYHSQQDISQFQYHSQQDLSQLQEVTQMLWLCFPIHKRARQVVQKGLPHLMYLVHRA